MSTSSRHNNKTKQAGQVSEKSTKTRQDGWTNVSALTDYTLAATTSRTNIPNKTGSTLH